MIRSRPIHSPVLSFASLTRRRFLAGAGAAALAPLLGCSTESPRYPSPKPGDTYFTNVESLPQTQSSAQLATWMETEHLEHSLDGWFFFGSLQDEDRPDDTGAFFLAFQRIALLPVGGAALAPAALGFNQKSVGRYEYAAVLETAPSDQVVVKSNPWSVELSTPFIAQPLITMRSVSGRMGEPGTVYLLTADIPYVPLLTPGLTGALRAEVRLRDRSGAVSQGYGSTAFCPQFLTAAQRQDILSNDGGSVGRYLVRTGDPMICQGSFYNQLPMLDVEQFSITVGGISRSKGTRGLLWLDYVVQSYDEQAKQVLLEKRATWEFFAIQLPDEGASMMVLHVDGANGSLPMATLHTADGARGRNGAREPTHSWPITGIDLQPDATSVWVSPASKKRYHQRYRIRLQSPEHAADLSIEMAIANQELCESEKDQTYKYEGLGIVGGTLDGRAVKGQAFMEVAPAVG